MRCLLCGLKGHKVTTCRKLARALELIRLDKQQYWNKKKDVEKGNTSQHMKRYQINEVDEMDSVNEAKYQFDEGDINVDCNKVDEINFPYSEFTEEEDQAYYEDN